MLRCPSILSAALFGLALGPVLAASATAEESETAPVFTVIEENARIAFAGDVNSFRRIDEDTFLLRAGANRWYRAEIAAPCGGGAVMDFDIAIQSGGAGGVDRFSRILVDDRSCLIRSLDRIAPPDL